MEEQTSSSVREDGPEFQFVPAAPVEVQAVEAVDGPAIKLEEVTDTTVQQHLEDISNAAVQVKLEEPPTIPESEVSYHGMPKVTKVEPGEGEMQVIYLNVPDTDEHHVLDISSLLAQQGIQVLDETEIQAIGGKDVGTSLFEGQDIIIEANDGSGSITISASQSETQSAQALLNLANVHADSGTVQVSEMLAGHEDKDKSGNTLLELSSDESARTYIVDESGNMIPLTDVREENMLQVDETASTTIAICQCFCGKQFLSQDELDKHKAEHKLSGPTPGFAGIETCSLCQTQFVGMKNLMQHHRDVHPGEMPWQCDICQKRYHKKIALKAHMRVHNQVARYQCSTCKKVFFYKSAMTRHIKQHICEKPYKCTICGEMLNTMWELRKHRINHQARSLFHCDICSKVFKQKATLVVHSRVHTGQRPYTCDICDKSFSLKSTLTQHKRIHTGEKPNICPICNQRFRQGSTLQSHMKRHTHDKPYICRYCRQRFAYQDELTEHELAHGENKKWQCDECGMKFKNQSLLARHARRHTNERPFVCEVCNKSFVQSGSLRAHMRSHTQEKPYYCRMCSKAYATSGTLLLHIRKVHNLNVKSVKEVFPVYKYVEDQKVFTIRSKPLQSNETVVNSDSMMAVSSVEESISAATGDENVVVSSAEGPVTTTNVTDIKSSGNSELVEETEQAPVSGEVGDVEVKSAVSTLTDHQASAPLPSADLPISDTGMVGAVTTLNDVWETHMDGDLVQVAAEVDVSSHSLHSAQDRQEAAIGLAELSLFGGNTATGTAQPDSAHNQEQQPPAQKTKTFFKEEEEDENDPLVTKIILSKEGGVMNSQDPHQCPICHRIFGRKSIMVEHLRIHTNEKPYECDYCSAGFRQNAQLRSHIRNRHTKVERYQCSFCHNRFLSRSIAIRHIKFHHKLKMKFAQEADPSWTVESAIWCDDKFEFNIEDPQYLKVGKRGKVTVKKGKKGVQEVEESTTEHEIDSSTVVETTEDGVKRVYKVLEPSIATSHGEVDTTAGVDTGEDCTKDGMQVSVNGQTVSTLTLPGDNGVDQHVSAAGADIDYIGSELLCGTCKMQFDSVSSLRAHLHDVHNTTLAESDVSYVFEDDINSDQPQSVASVVVGEETPLQEKKPPQGKKSTQTGGKSSSRKKTVETSVDGMQENICRVCRESFYYRDDLDQHMKSHSEEEVESVGMHRCDTCFLAFKNTQEVAKHIQRTHGVPTIYSCSICDKQFYQESSVYRHMKFFHKWEIKIRGESNIPVIVKPAPVELQKPVSVGNYTMPRTRVDRRKYVRVSKVSDSGANTTPTSAVTKVENMEDDTLMISLQGEGSSLETADVDDSNAESDAAQQNSSYIIVKNGSLTDEEGTQKLVEKLMELLSTKAGEKKGKMPKIVKVTTVGLDKAKVNTITEIDISQLQGVGDIVEKGDNILEISSDKPSTHYSDVNGDNDMEQLCSVNEKTEIPNSALGEETENTSMILSGEAEKAVSELYNETEINITSSALCEETEQNSSIEGTDNAASKDCISTLQGKRKISVVKSGEHKVVSSTSKEKTVTISQAGSSDPTQIGDPVAENVSGVPIARPEEETVSSNKTVNIKSKEFPVLLDMLCSHEPSPSIDTKSQNNTVTEETESHPSVEVQTLQVEIHGEADRIENVTLTSSFKNSNIRTLPVSFPSDTPQRKDKKSETQVDSPSTTLDIGNSPTTRSKRSKTSSVTDLLTQGKVAKVSITKLPSSPDKKAESKLLKSETCSSSSMPSPKTTKVVKGKGAVKSAESPKGDKSIKKKSVEVEPVPQRRSSSGRLIKRKMFGDDIEDMSPIGKVKR